MFNLIVGVCCAACCLMSIKDRDPIGLIILNGLGAAANLYLAFAGGIVAAQ